MRRSAPVVSLSFVIALAFVALPVGGCLGSFAYEKGAPPIAHTTAYVEQSPEVADAIGGPVDVSLAVTRELDRSLLSATLRGHDSVRLDTTVKGSRREARLVLTATNLDGQGWAGDFYVEVEGQRVLVDGQYTSVGGGRLLEGKLSADGHPIVKRN